MADVFCPHCGKILPGHANPLPTVDVIIRHPGKGIVLVRRRFPPLGWALPGGFVDYGEAVESAAVREALEETGLVVRLTGLVGVYSDPARDARKIFHRVFRQGSAHCRTHRRYPDAGLR